MTRIIAIANQKGGVGKTTTTVNLAASLARAGRNVLMVDLDPQGNATMGSGIEKNEVECSVYDLLTSEATFSDVVTYADQAGYEVLPANSDLTAAEVFLLSSDKREGTLKKIFNENSLEFDFVLIDCPPSLNMLTVNALVAADSVLIPMQCEYYALEGLSALSNTIQAIADNLNPKLEIEGILRTMFDPRNRLTLDVSEQLKDYFGDKVYRTVIPRNIRLAEAPSYGLPVMAYDISSRGALAYIALAGEILRKAAPAKVENATSQSEESKE
jgi:chromosome partitioning protein